MSKYKLRLRHKDSQKVTKLKINIKQGLFEQKISVKDKSEGLYPEFRNKKVAKIHNYGNGIKFQIEGTEFELDYCQEAYLFAALYSRLQGQYDIELKDETEF